MPTSLPFRSTLDFPALGLEAEFTAVVDDEIVVPEDYWRQPQAFIGQPLLRRGTKSAMLPTGGAIYFDGGVIELVTPALELEPLAPARVVRNLWRQISSARGALDEWQSRTGHHVRLQAFSAHYNVSFELERSERGRDRTIQKLALLLAHLLPTPLIVLGANRLSSGVGVRPRRNRIEVTFDFTPDAGLMTCCAALITGIVREVMEWPGFLLRAIEARGIVLPAEVEPVRHTTRKGWLVRAAQFPRDPFTTDPDAEVWKTTAGSSCSFRQIAFLIASRFRHSIRRHCDPFTYRLLFSVLRGELPSLLESPKRPPGYEDVGRGNGWGIVLPHLRDPGGRGSDVLSLQDPPWSGDVPDRRRRVRDEIGDRRRTHVPLPSSAYETVFVHLASGRRLNLNGETLAPVSMKGWSNAILRNQRTGEETLLSIDQIAEQGAWLDES